MQAFITNIIGVSKKNPIIMIYNDGIGAKPSRRTAFSSFPIHLDPSNSGRMVYSSAIRTACRSIFIIVPFDVTMGTSRSPFWDHRTTLRAIPVDKGHRLLPFLASADRFPFTDEIMPKPFNSNAYEYNCNRTDD